VDRRPSSPEVVREMPPPDAIEKGISQGDSAWTNGTNTPPMFMDAVLSVYVGFAVASYVTVPLPAPDAVPLIESHAELLKAVHGQVDGVAVTVS
jgi:hypothetical protein